MPLLDQTSRDDGSGLDSLLLPALLCPWTVCVLSGQSGSIGTGRPELSAANATARRLTVWAAGRNQELPAMASSCLLDRAAIFEWGMLGGCVGLSAPRLGWLCQGLDYMSAVLERLLQGLDFFCLHVLDLWCERSY